MRCGKRRGCLSAGRGLARAVWGHGSEHFLRIADKLQFPIFMVQDAETEKCVQIPEPESAVRAVIFVPFDNLPYQQRGGCTEQHCALLKGRRSAADPQHQAAGGGSQERYDKIDKYDRTGQTILPYDKCQNGQHGKVPDADKNELCRQASQGREAG